MDYNYHKLKEIDAVIIEASLESYLMSLKKEKSDAFNRRTKKRLDEEIYLTHKTITNFKESLNKDEEE